MNFIGKTWSFEKSKFSPIFFLQAINVRKTRYTFFVVFFFLYWNIILFFFSFCSVELFFLILRTCNVGTIPFVTQVFLATNAGIDMQENHFQIFFIYTIYRVSQMYGTPWITFEQLTLGSCILFDICSILIKQYTNFIVFQVLNFQFIIVKYNISCIICFIKIDLLELYTCVTAISKPKWPKS